MLSLRCCACAAKFWIYWAFTFLTLSFFTFYGQMTVAISPNVQVSPSYFCVRCKPQGARRLRKTTMASHHGYVMSHAMRELPSLYDSGHIQGFGFPAISPTVQVSPSSSCVRCKPHETIYRDHYHGTASCPLDEALACLSSPVCMTYGSTVIAYWRHSAVASAPSLLSQPVQAERDGLDWQDS